MMVIKMSVIMGWQAPNGELKRMLLNLTLPPFVVVNTSAKTLWGAQRLSASPRKCHSRRRSLTGISK